jgi:hypothetical protein
VKLDRAARQCGREHVAFCNVEVQELTRTGGQQINRPWQARQATGIDRRRLAGLDLSDVYTIHVDLHHEGGVVFDVETSISLDRRRARTEPNTEKHQSGKGVHVASLEV